MTTVLFIVTFVAFRVYPLYPPRLSANILSPLQIKAFILQTGDPTNTGKGGKSIYGEYFEDEINPALRHDKRGVVAMANKSKPNTNGSQFYITYAKAVHLDGKNTVFGKVIDGWDTLDKIEEGEVDKKYRPLKGKEVKIESITVHANPLAG